MCSAVNVSWVITAASKRAVSPNNMDILSKDFIGLPVCISDFDSTFVIADELPNRSANAGQNEIAAAGIAGKPANNNRTSWQMHKRGKSKTE